MNYDVLNWLDEIVYIVDIETHDVLYMNTRCLTALGLTQENYKGRKCYRVVQHLDRPCPFCTTSMISEDKFYEWEHFNPVLRRHFHIKDKKIIVDGRPCRFEVAVDITDLKRETQRAVNHGRALEGSVPGAVCVLSEDLYVLWYNDIYLDIVGYSREEYARAQRHISLHAHAKDMQTLEEMAKNSKETGELHYFPTQVTRPDGGVVNIIASIMYRKDEDGKGLFYSMGIDITDYVQRIEAEGKRLQLALDDAKKASLAKDRFLSRMSHELRTPLNGIIGMSQVALSSLDNTVVVEEAQRKVSNAAKYLLALLNDILDLANMETGAFALNAQPFMFGDLLGDLGALYAHEARRQRLYFTIDFEYFSQEWLNADCLRVKQVLGNVLSNAFKFTPQGGKVELKVRCTRKEGDTLWVEFVVKDSGVGMSTEFMKKIFVPFEQEACFLTAEHHGLGLGLPICRHLVSTMQGRMSMESTKGQGTICAVELPFEVEGEWREGLAAEYLEKLAALRVLLVDNSSARDNFTAMAQSLGISVDTAADGAEALLCLDTARQKGRLYDLCLVDARAENLEASGFAAHLRRGGTDVPLCMAGVFSFSSGRELATSLGITRMLRKPYLALPLVDALIQLDMLPPRPAFEERHMSYDFTGKRILLVEDNPINSEVACELLSKLCKFTIDTAGNGKEAVDMFEAKPRGYYHLVLMDISMPIMDGLAASRAIRKNAAKGGEVVPIVALSANAFDEDKERSRQCGINVHMPKPLDMQTLCPVLASLLETAVPSDHCAL